MKLLSEEKKHRLHEIIYEADTKAGKLFDIILLILIIASIVLVMLESIQAYDEKYHDFFNISEWIITILFTIEYFARIICVQNPKKYIFSFYGIVDLLSTIPKYISIIFGGTHMLVILRALRLLRVFRILKLVQFVGEGEKLFLAIKSSRHKIFVFILAVLITCTIIGTMMYLIEGNDDEFTSIPRSIYWAIVTLTTVGYGDISPDTALGQFLASIVMILGYGVIAIPTGIVTAEYSKQIQNTPKPIANTQSCPYCLASKHRYNAIYCHQCGELLNEVKSS